MRIDITFCLRQNTGNFRIFVTFDIKIIDKLNIIRYNEHDFRTGDGALTIYKAPYPVLFLNRRCDI